MRRDLSLPYRAVQGGHAVAQWMMDHAGTWQNEYLIYLDVPDLQALERWIYKLDLLEVSYSVFREPDLDNELTAVAVLNHSKLFKKLRTMR